MGKPKNFLVFILCSLVLAFCSFSYSQSPWVKQWDHRFGGRHNDILNGFIQTGDGGYLLAGYSISGLNGDKSQPSRGGNDFWIIKTDGNGIKQWDKRFGGSLNDYLNSVKQTRDGGFILGGSSSSGSNGDKSEAGRGLNDYWIVKIDGLGVKEWDKRFGGSNEDFLTSIIQTKDNGYFLAGISRSDSSGDKTQSTKGGYDYWMVRTDSLGNKLWDADIGGTDDEQLKSAMMLSNGGYILGGSSISDAGGDKTQPTWGSYDYWIVKTDSLGIVQWDKDIGGTGVDMLQSFGIVNDGGFITGGFSESGISGNKTESLIGAQDYWMVKIDSAGTILWDQCLGNIDVENDVGSTFQNADGGFIICGESQSAAGGDKTENNLGLSQAWIVKTDSAGDKSWDITIMTTPEVKVYPYAFQTKNGCFVIAYSSWAGIAGAKTEENRDTTHSTTDYWIIKYCDTTLQPLASFTADSLLCPGTCTSFNNYSLYAASYQWTFNGASITGSMDENPQNICYNNPGSYDVTLIAVNANGNDTIVFANYITVYPYPAPQSITQIGDTLFALQGAQSYQWFYNGLPVNGANGYFYLASQSGDYNVVCSDSNGCEVEAVIFNVLAETSENIRDTGRWLPYPNPVFDMLFLPAEIAERSKGVVIYNLQGEIILESDNDGTTSIDCSRFEPGTYLIEISLQDRMIRNIFTRL